MLKHVFVLMVLVCFTEAFAVCTNIHCRFEYVGVQDDFPYTQHDFMNQSAVGKTYEKYYAVESLPFRQLKWTFVGVIFCNWKWYYYSAYRITFESFYEN